MKIGINIYIKSNNRTQIVGTANIDCTEGEIVIIFGGVIPYDNLKKLLNPDTKPNDKAEVFSFESGFFELVVYKLDN